MESYNSDNNYAPPPPPPPPPPPVPPQSQPLPASLPQDGTSTSLPMSQAEFPPVPPPPMLQQSPPLPANPPQHWIMPTPPMSQTELPPPLPAQLPQHWTWTSPPMSQAEPPPQYYFQPMVMPPPLHYQPAPWMPPPGQYNADPGMYGPGIPAPYEYNYPGYLRTWSTDLCDCTADAGNCLVTAFCPWVTFGQISEIINEGQTSCWEGCLMYGAVSLFLGLGSGGICTGIFGGLYRNKLRRKYKLRGTLFNDFLVHALCEPCALCQEYRELGRFGFEVPLGWKENMEMQKAATAVYQVAPIIEQGMTR